MKHLFIKNDCHFEISCVCAYSVHLYLIIIISPCALQYPYSALTEHQVEEAARKAELAL